MNHSYSPIYLEPSERPRERLLAFGAESLSTVELLAVILGTGTRDRPVLKLAQEILGAFGCLKSIAEATIEELVQIQGLGKIKAIQLKGALALGMRASRSVVEERLKIEHPRQAYDLVREDLVKEVRELFLVILLDARGGVICKEMISVGTLTTTLIHPREVFYPAIRHRAVSLILAHNHPSGDPSASPQDLEITETLIEVSRVMGIPIQDHIIIGSTGYTSLRQQGIKF